MNARMTFETQIIQPSLEYQLCWNPYYLIQGVWIRIMYSKIHLLVDTHFTNLIFIIQPKCKTVSVPLFKGAFDSRNIVLFNISFNQSVYKTVIYIADNIVFWKHILVIFLLFSIKYKSKYIWALTAQISNLFTFCRASSLWCWRPAKV